MTVKLNCRDYFLTINLFNQSIIISSIHLVEIFLTKLSLLIIEDDSIHLQKNESIFEAGNNLGFGASLRAWSFTHKILSNCTG